MAHTRTRTVTVAMTHWGTLTDGDSNVTRDTVTLARYIERKVTAALAGWHGHDDRDGHGHNSPGFRVSAGRVGPTGTVTEVTSSTSDSS